jgi:hypothetical protein
MASQIRSMNEDESTIAPPSETTYSERGATVGFWRNHSQIFITYDWEKQESTIYIDGEPKFIIPLQPKKEATHDES